MNNTVQCGVILDNAPKKVSDKNSPFLDVGIPKKEIKGPELYPLEGRSLEAYPIKYWELLEMENKLCLYIQKTSDPLHKYYIQAIEAIDQIIELEREIADRKKAEKCK